MKERPILFSAPMVRALLDGTKTQTRRVCKLPPAPANLGQWEPFIFGGEGCRDSHGRPVSGQMTIAHSRTGAVVGCPYGIPGDRLWVREAWARTHVFGHEMTVYREGDNRTDYGGPWKPGIHMFRRDSRIVLEITGVRVERLQEISEADADAEGCERLDNERDERDRKLCPQCGGTRLYTAHSYSGAFPDTDCTKCDTYVKRYRHLWEAINGPGSWDANPWVWAVSFKVVRP